MFVGSQSFISLPNFMFVSAVVSEIRELKEKKEKKLTISNLTTFPGHLIYIIHLQQYIRNMYHFNFLHYAY